MALELSWQCGTLVQRDRGMTQNQLVDWDVASGLESGTGTEGSVCPQLSVMTTGWLSEKWDPAGGNQGGRLHLRGGLTFLSGGLSLHHYLPFSPSPWPRGTPAGPPLLASFLYCVTVSGMGSF